MNRNALLLWRKPQAELQTSEGLSYFSSPFLSLATHRLTLAICGSRAPHRHLSLTATPRGTTNS